MQKIRILTFILVYIFSSNLYATSLNQTMEVKIGVFDAAKIEVQYVNQEDRYNIKTIVRTANFFDKLYPFEASYSSVGKNLKKSIMPEIYDTYTKSRSNIRTKKILYDNNGKAYKRESSKNNKYKTVAIKNIPQTATLADMQTFFADLIKNFDETRSCAINKEIYDGKKHFKIIAKDNDVETVYSKITKQNVNAYKCSIYIENLKDNNDNILWDVSAEKPINLHIGLDEKSKVPYVLQIKIDDTPLGKLIVTPISLETN